MFGQRLLGCASPGWPAVGASAIVGAGPGGLPLQQDRVGASVGVPTIVIVLELVRQLVRDDRHDQLLRCVWPVIELNRPLVRSCQAAQRAWASLGWLEADRHTAAEPRAHPQLDTLDRFLELWR